MNVAKLKRRPKHLHNFTGLTVAQFEMLCKAVEQGRLEQWRSGQRQRAVGGGRKAKLNLEQQVLLALLYYRLYVTQMLLGYLFDLDDSNVSRLIAELRPVLQTVLPVPTQETLLFSKEPRRRIGTLEELLRKHPELKEVLIDATEQEVRKPKDKARRKSHYSGKKKRHTLKTQVTSTSECLLLHVSRSVQGRVNDLTLLRASGILRELPPELEVRVDRGYDGVARDYPKRRIEQPHKARRNKPLDLVQRLINGVQNSARIKVENAFAHLKRFKLLAGIYRGPESSYDDTFLTIAGLHNFRKLGRLSW